MITLYQPSDKGFGQKDYEQYYKDAISSCNFYEVSCSCKMKGHFIKHGYYSRNVKTPVGYIYLHILRIRCKHCGRTHAILPSFVVPYSRHLLEDHIRIAKATLEAEPYLDIMEDNPYIDPGNINYIKKKFIQHWKERIRSISLSLMTATASIIRSCFLSFNRQFMQIRRGWNSLYY